LTDREWFLIVLMFSIQFSNHFWLWLSVSCSNTKWIVFFILDPCFCHRCKVTWKLVSWVWVHLNWCKSGFHLFIFLIIFYFGWVEVYEIQNNMCFSYLIHDFVTAEKLLGILCLVCECIWIDEREQFPTVLMWWI